MLLAALPAPSFSSIYVAFIKKFLTPNQGIHLEKVNKLYSSMYGMKTVLK